MTDRPRQPSIRGGDRCAVPVCRVKPPPADGCSHVDCPHRRPLTAHPKRDGDGLIPPRGAGSRNY